MKGYNCSYSGNGNQQKSLPIFSMFGFMTIIMLIVVSCGSIWAKTTNPASVVKQANSPIIAKCKADLAKRLKLQAQYVKVVEVQATTWPDASLGLPEAGKVYAQMITPGSRVILEARNSQYLYTTSAKTYKYGGPTNIWYFSMLYTKPVQDEPNLNGDLYQCSLLGTNCVRLVSGVRDFYPQENGGVIFSQRTSRSSHTLLYVKANEAGKVKTLHSAFDFGEAAINSAQDQWAGFVRPTLGAVWNVVVARIGESNGNEQTLPLPEGFKPGRIAWSGEMLLILSKKGDQMVCFETSPKTGTSEWKAVGCQIFPGLDSYMLNKSETLEINQISENGKPSVEVVRIWFTGDRNVKATISGITLRGYDLLGPYAFIWGEKGSEPVAYTVNIVTGEVIPSFHGVGQDIKPFRYPPINNPLVLKKSK